MTTSSEQVVDVESGEEVDLADEQLAPVDVLVGHADLRGRGVKPVTIRTRPGLVTPFTPVFASITGLKSGVPVPPLAAMAVLSVTPMLNSVIVVVTITPAAEDLDFRLYLWAGKKK